MENQKDSFESMAVDYISGNASRAREYGLIYTAMKHAVKWQLEQTRSFVDQLASAHDVVLDQNTKTLEKGQEMPFLDYWIKNCENSDGLVLYRKMGSRNYAHWECHLGNYGSGDAASVLSCKKSALVHYMLKRSALFNSMLAHRLLYGRGNMAEFYILKKVLEEEMIPMPDCISISMDGNCSILFNKEKF